MCNEGCEHNCWFVTELLTFHLKILIFCWQSHNDFPSMGEIYCFALDVCLSVCPVWILWPLCNTMSHQFQILFLFGILLLLSLICTIANQIWTSEHEKAHWYLGYEGRKFGIASRMSVVHCFLTNLLSFSVGKLSSTEYRVLLPWLQTGIFTVHFLKFMYRMGILSERVMFP